ncbi:MAG: bifunctional methylenetetrahydrofolate dehydrogenase/methenyltetrahydrofolate cyclohydrolase FolD [Spirochaetales bacterium]|nr:bifunctional methylenetetrahydrofolate dehydrogenase/methenyltetrahydrofolate cyclohydrolase FolD [Spirochaetales bacterium]
MLAEIISGNEISQDIRTELKLEVQKLKEKGIVPGLGVILVGDDPASRSYVTAKERDCEEVGIYSDDNRLPETTSEADLLALVEKMNNDPKIHGILVQLPVPKHIDSDKVLNAISPEKDVDGFHPINVGRMVTGQEAFLPCTPNGVLEMLKRKGLETSGKKVVVVGRSNIVGKPVANLLLGRGKNANATVTICHTGTADLKAETLQADIIIAAAGQPNMIKADMVREGAIVIDVGVNRIEDSSKKSGFRLCGDVEFDTVKEKASYITPVPGGVGPMTRTMLLFNIVKSAKKHNGVK